MVPTTTLPLQPPPDFNLRSTVRSHGWSDLAPFACDRTGDTLTIALPEGQVTVTKEGTRLVSQARPSAAEKRRVTATVASCLRFDLDLSEFWTLCEDDPELRWAAEHRAGRFLRAPTAFADAAMTLATTNCSWAMTRHITSALVERWGENGAFPSAERMRRVSEADLRKHASVGYRAPFFRALARNEDLESLRTAEDAEPRLLALRGFGRYAADSMLRLLGRHDTLGLDSAVIPAWKRRYPRRKATASAIGKRLKRYGKYKGTAFWLLCHEHWYHRDAWLG